MATGTEQQGSAAERRRAARNALVAAVAQQRDGQVDTAALIDSHPELMPELKDVCDEFAAIQQIDAAASISHGATAAQHHRSVLVDGYEIVRLIRRGGQAEVYEAVRTATQQRVALKVFFGSQLVDDREKKRFEREVESLASITHPNVVTILDCGTSSDQTQYLATPYIEGKTLDAFVRDWWQQHPGEQLVPVELLALFVRIARAVQAAHSKSIVHRDIKPSNIIIDDHGEPYILDFGLARKTVCDLMAADRSVSLTVSGQFVGSLSWASPEQVSGNVTEVDCRTDVYSLGLILYFMLSAQMPYRTNGRLADIINSIVNAEPVPLSTVLSARSHTRKRVMRWRRRLVDPSLEAVVTKSLAKRRDMRYASAGIFADDVDRLMAGQKTLARATHQRGWTRRTMAATVVIMSLLSLLAFAGFQPTRPSLFNEPHRRAAGEGQPASIVPLGAVPFRGHAYMAVESYMDWQTATERARQFGGYLVEIDDAAEQQFVSGMLGIGTPEARSGKQYWLGAQGRDHAWSTGRGNPLTFENWHPQSRDDGGDVAASTSGFIWYRTPRQTQLMAIIEWDDLPPSRTTSRDVIPFDAVRYGGSAYKLIATPTTWPDAREACRAMGGDLACAGSDGERAFLQSMVSHADACESAWVGARFFEQYLGWIDGTEGSNLPLWRQGGIHTYECVFVAGHEWGAAAGVLHETRRGYICEWTDVQSHEPDDEAAGL